MYIFFAFLECIQLRNKCNGKYKKKMKIVMFEHHTNGKYESEQKILFT